MPKPVQLPGGAPAHPSVVPASVRRPARRGATLLLSGFLTILPSKPDAADSSFSPVPPGSYLFSIRPDSIVTSAFMQAGEALPHAHEVAHALEIAGPNRKELEKAIQHFQNRHDAAGLSAVCQLIGESAYLFHARYARGIRAEEGETPDLIRDAAVLTGDYLIRHVERRLGMRDASNPHYPHYAWIKDVPRPVFEEAVLPYRGQTEAVSSPALEDYLFDERKFDQLNLGISYADFQRKINGFSGQYEFAAGEKERIEVMQGLIRFINTALLVDLAGRRYAPRGPEDMDIVSALREKSGRCTDLCHGTLYLLRALGIPAVHDRVPLWAGAEDNHTWLTIPMPYKTFSVNGGCPCEGGNCAPDYFNAQGYGRTAPGSPFGILLRQSQGAQPPYSVLMRSLLDKHGKEWILKNCSMPEIYYLLGTDAKPAGSDYYAPQTLQLAGFTPGELYHLAVFNGGKFNAILPAIADGHGGLAFEGIQGNSNLYAVVRYVDGNPRVQSAPFLLGDRGEKSVLNAPSPVPAHVRYNSVNRRPDRALQPRKSYGLFSFHGAGWTLDQLVTTDAQGDAEMSLAPGILFYLRPIASGLSSDVREASGLRPGERYTLYAFENGDWERVRNETADTNGDVSFGGVGPGSICSISHWYSPNVRPFTLNNRDGALEFH